MKIESIEQSKANPKDFFIKLDDGKTIDIDKRYLLLSKDGIYYTPQEIKEKELEIDEKQFQ